MADIKREKRLQLWTPRVTGIYPWLQKADTKFNAEGEFRVRGRAPTGDWAPLLAQLQPILDTYVQAEKDKVDAKVNPEKAGKMKKAKVCPIFKDVIGTDGEPTGERDGNFKMKAVITYKEKDGSPTSKNMRPQVWDAKGTVTKKNPWSGSILRVLFFPMPYFSAKDYEFGLSLKMIGVQIIKLVEASAMTAADYGLEVVEDGFTDDFDGADSDMAEAGTTRVGSGSAADF